MIVVTTAIGYLVTAVVLPVVLLLVLVQDIVDNQLLFDRLIKAVCRALPLAFGVRVRVVGPRPAVHGAAVVFMANHVSVFDPIILYGHIRCFVRAIELEDHFSWPVWGQIVRRAGNIPISHRHPRRAIASLRRAAELVTGGTSLVVLPEGHRTRTGELGRFMRGAFRLVTQVDADVVPVALVGLYERKSVHSPLVRPGSVVLAFGRPIPAGLIAKLSDRELMRRVRAAIAELLSTGSTGAKPVSDSGGVVREGVVRRAGSTDGAGPTAGTERPPSGGGAAGRVI